MRNDVTQLQLEKCTHEPVAPLRCQCHSCSFKKQFQIWGLWFFMDAETCVVPLPLLKDKFSLPCLPCRNQIHEIPKSYQFLFLFFLIRASCRLGDLARYCGTNAPIFLLLKWLENVGSSVVNPPASSCNFKDSKFQPVLSVWRADLHWNGYAGLEYFSSSWKDHSKSTAATDFFLTMSVPENESTVIIGCMKSSPGFNWRCMFVALYKRSQQPY